VTLNGLHSVTNLLDHPNARKPNGLRHTVCKRTSSSAIYQNNRNKYIMGYHIILSLDFCTKQYRLFGSSKDKTGTLSNDQSQYTQGRQNVYEWSRRKEFSL